MTTGSSLGISELPAGSGRGPNVSEKSNSRVSDVSLGGLFWELEIVLGGFEWLVFN